MSAPSAWITTSTVLQRLTDVGDRDAWTRFIERFRSPIVAYARQRGLSESDSEDAAQETLASFAAAYRAGAYDKTRGRLSSWLFGFANNMVRHAQARTRRAAADETVESWSNIAAPATVDPQWEELWERSVLEHCLSAARGEFKGSTWRVFEMLVLENHTIEDAVAESGLSRNAVYIAKHRVLTRVEALVRDCDEVI